MAMFYFVALVMAATAATANVVHNGNCPEDLKAVANFNVTAYQGLWYEVSKYPYETETKGKCSTAEYKLDGQSIKVKNTHVVNGVQTSIEGEAKLAPDASGSGRLVVSLKFGDRTKESPLWVLATDYVNYAVAYNCKYDEKTKSHQDYSIAYNCKYDEETKNHQDFAWILSRSKKLEGEPKKAVDAFVKATKQLDAEKFLQTDFSEEACKFTSSALITEPPAPVPTKPAA